MAKRGKKPKGVTLQQEAKRRGRPPKAKGNGAHPAAGRKVAKTDNQPSEDAIRENFLQHRGVWNQLGAKQKLLDEQWKDAKAALKADGHKVVHMHIADALSNSAKSEAKIYGEVEDRLKVARYIGHKLGAQYDLFAQPDRTPLVDSAYDSGKQASMENETKKPPFDPSNEAYNAWMRGYDDHQKTLMAKFQPLQQDAPGWGGSGEDDDL